MKLFYGTLTLYLFLVAWVICIGSFYSILIPALITISVFIFLLFFIKGKNYAFPLSLFAIVPSVILLSEKNFFVGFITMVLFLVPYYINQSKNNLKIAIRELGIFLIAGSVFSYFLIEGQSLVITLIVVVVITGIFIAILFIERYGHEFLTEAEGT